MKWGFRRESELEILSSFRMLRVTVKPKFQVLPFFLEALGLGTFIFLGWDHWVELFRKLPFFCTSFLVGALISVWYRITGREEIEFDGQKRILAIHKKIVALPYTREFSLDALTSLEPHYSGNNTSPQGLQARAGGRIIIFGQGVDQVQANRILAELQRAFPEESHVFLAGNSPFDKHFTTLKLS